MVVATAVRRLRDVGYQVTRCCAYYGLKYNTYKSACRRLKHPLVDRKGQAKAMVTAACEGNRMVYGYRRVREVCKANGLSLGEKSIRTIMREEHLQPKMKRTKRYSSYKGETAHRPANRCLVGDIDTVTKNGTHVSQRYRSQADRRRQAGRKDLVHDFYADAPNQRLGTDITEFQCADGKVFFSPLIDFHDNMPIAYTCATRPAALLTNTMLEAGLEQIQPGQRPELHTDRGWHYRHIDWVDRLTDISHDRQQCTHCTEENPCDNAWLMVPSLSRLGNSGDNARVEGFFGTIKRELHASGIRPEKHTTEEFMKYLDDYLDWFVFDRLTTGPDGQYTTLAKQRNLAKTT